jgi:hypothetical protein
MKKLDIYISSCEQRAIAIRIAIAKSIYVNTKKPFSCSKNKKMVSLICLSKIYSAVPFSALTFLDTNLSNSLSI